MNIKTAPNINYLWAMLTIEELSRNGVEMIFISPGSRSSALALAVANHPRLKSLVHFDERGSGFAALGYAAANKKPTAIITTSGTAVANLYPAVVEASKKKLPLIILTADRPPELRHTGAHQTIDQVNFFGKYTQWNFDLPCPTKDITPAFVLTTVNQALYRAKSGPVHLNCMFREPLSPEVKKENLQIYLKPLQIWLKSNKPFTIYQQANQIFSAENLNEVVSVISKSKRGTIVVGKLSNTKEQQIVLQLAEKLNWPIFPDISSGLRLGTNNRQVIAYYDQVLLSPKFAKRITPDCVLHLGGRITSKRWYQFIEKTKPENYIMVLNHPLRNDPLHNVTLRIQSSITTFCKQLTPRIKLKTPNSWISHFKTANQKIASMLENQLDKTNVLSETAVARKISKLIPQNTALFLSNSLPIREMDMYAVNNGHPIRIEGNRGASGIDGIIATATGFSLGLQKRVTLFVGDLAFLHDLNSLALLKNLNHPMTIVILNNDGGGIFSFLPIASHKIHMKNFEKFFGTPHGLTFKETAKLFNLKYANPKSMTEFSSFYRESFQSKQSNIIEITSQRENNFELAQKISKAIQTSL